MEKQKLPNSTIVLVLGILSILGCCCYGLPGLIAGIVAVILANKDLKLFNENPENYLDTGNIKAGKIMGIIGIILSILFIIYLIVVISYFGIDTLQNPELLQERIQELQGMQ